MTANTGPGTPEVHLPTHAARLDGVRMIGFRSASEFRKRIMPWPRYAIVLNCSASPFHADGLPAGASGVLGGMVPDPVRIGGEVVDCVEVQLSPLVVASLLGVAPAELNRPMPTIDELWDVEARRLREQLIEIPDWDRRFALVEEHLAARARSPHRVDGEVADAWQRIRRSGGQLPVARLAGDYGWSRTRFWSRFSGQVGLSPKRAARVVRFDRALRLISDGHPLAGVAADCGYADQSHLHRDVAEFAGTTPGALRADPHWNGDPAWVLDGPLR